MFMTDEYMEGKRAFREGYGRDENPYQDCTPEFSEWEDGYDDADGESQMGNH